MSSQTGKDLSRQDLRRADLTEQVLFGTDLRGAKLYGLKISLTCDTWDGVKLDDQQVAMLLLMISQADMAPLWQERLRGLVEECVGEHEFRTLQRYLQLS